MYADPRAYAMYISSRIIRLIMGSLSTTAARITSLAAVLENLSELSKLLPCSDF